ncbi:MAG: HAD family hydrolase [Butyrivibrio sp.]|nr:HAD family hydrolase [Butyrivibrio sp.]
MNKEYKNYIFDLYGTLIDIHTDETKKKFWKQIADIYAENGALYKPGELREKYIQLVKEEEQKITLEKGYKYPEIKLETVFARLLKKDFPEAKKEDIEVLQNSRLVQNIAASFRKFSRTKLEVYPYTIELLQRLKDDGKKIYLLSNAQHLFTLPEMDSCGITGFFDGIYISSLKGMKKPQPEFIESLILEYNMNKAESVMIGNDLFSDIGSAMSAGVDGIFLNNYNDTPEKIKKTYKELCNKYNSESTIYLEGEKVLL